MVVEGKIVGIRALSHLPPGTPSSGGSTSEPKPRRPQRNEAANTVELRKRGCDYFIVEGPRGYYLIEWHGGYDPDKGDGILGDIGGYGFKDILYRGGQSGRIYVDDYLLSKDRVLEKFNEKCRSWREES